MATVLLFVSQWTCSVLGDRDLGSILFRLSDFEAFWNRSISFWPSEQVFSVGMAVDLVATTSSGCLLLQFAILSVGFCFDLGQLCLFGIFFFVFDCVFLIWLPI